jgi:hypothetical protein
MRDPVMMRSIARRDSASTHGGVLIDPRQGDVEGDASSPRERSLLAITGSLLVEISLPKLLFAWTISLLLPAVLLGVAPLVASAWLATVSRHILQLTEIGSALALVVIIAQVGRTGSAAALTTLCLAFGPLCLLLLDPTTEVPT